jgi:putative ABC transport system ATP-binding protein
VLFDIDLDIEQGSLTALVSPSGSGKTTALTLMGCLRQVQSGSVQLLGTELHDASEEKLVVSRRQLGFIFQAHTLHESLTAMQNVRLGVEVQGPQAIVGWERAASHLLGLLGLGDRLHCVPSKLSTARSSESRSHGR